MHAPPPKKKKKGEGAGVSLHKDEKGAGCCRLWWQLFPFLNGSGEEESWLSLALHLWVLLVVALMLLVLERLKFATNYY